MKPKSFFELPEEEQKRIINKAAQASNEAQAKIMNKTIREEISQIVLETRDNSRGYSAVGIIDTVDQLEALVEREKNKFGTSEFEAGVLAGKTISDSERLKDIEELESNSLENLLSQVPPRIFYSKGKVIFEPDNMDEWNEIADKAYTDLLFFSLDVVSEKGKTDGWMACYGDDGISVISAKDKSPVKAIKKLLHQLKERQ